MFTYHFNFFQFQESNPLLPTQREETTTAAPFEWKKRIIRRSRRRESVHQIDLFGIKLCVQMTNQIFLNRYNRSGGGIFSGGSTAPASLRRQLTLTNYKNCQLSKTIQAEILVPPDYVILAKTSYGLQYISLKFIVSIR